MKPTKDLQLDWDKQQGLVPAIVQDFESRRVLMLAYLNRTALEQTLETGRVTFWSRSRQQLWAKGETSGNRLELVSVEQDCDGDTLLIQARPTGPVCHRGTTSCFALDASSTTTDFLPELERVLAARIHQKPAGSYTAKLAAQGVNQILRKVGEEALELIFSAQESPRRSVEEAADLIFHLLVFLVRQGIPWSEVVEELARRRKASGSTTDQAG